MYIPDSSRESLRPANRPYHVKHILVPLNGTACAEEALALAARIARERGATITLLRVVPPNRCYERYPLNLAIIEEEPCPQEIERAQTYLRAITASACLEGIDVRSEVLTICSVLAIVQYALVYQVDLIVMCSHGYTGLTRWIHGSVAQQLFRQCPIPILVIRQDYSSILFDVRPFSILVALDGSPLAETIIPLAALLSASLSAPARGHLHLLRVVPPACFVDDRAADIAQKMNEEAIEWVQLYLQQVQRTVCLDQPVDITASVALSAALAATTIQVAEEGETENGQRISDGYAAIAIATHRQRALPRWVSGSIAEQMLGKTRLPLLVMPHPYQKVRPAAIPLPNREKQYQAE